MTLITNPTSLATSNVNTGGVVTTSASISPSAAGVQFLWFFAKRTGGFTDTAVVAGNGRTWVKVQSQATGNYYAALFVGYGASPSTGTVTITFNATPSAGRYAIIQQTGFNDVTVNPVASSAQSNSTGTSSSVTLPSSEGRTHIAFAGHDVSEAYTPDTTGATWPELVDSGAVPMGVHVQYILFGGDLVATASWTSSVVWGAAVVALKKESYADCTLIDDSPVFGVAKNGLAVAIEGDEEGPAVAGKPSGVWAIVGGS